MHKQSYQGNVKPQSHRENESFGNQYQNKLPRSESTSGSKILEPERLVSSKPSNKNEVSKRNQYSNPIPPIKTIQPDKDAQYTSIYETTHNIS